MIKRQIFAASLAALALMAVACSSNKPAEPPASSPSSEALPAAPEPDKAVIGEVQSVEPSGKHIVVRTSDGKDHHVHIAHNTKVHSLHHASEAGHEIKEGAKEVAGGVKKGTLAAVHFAEKEGKIVASHVKHGVKDVVKESEVVIKKVDNEGKVVFAKAKDGTEHVFHVGKEATVTTGHKLAHIGKVSGEKVKEGTKATVHFTEESGKKIAHFFKHHEE